MHLGNQLLSRGLIYLLLDHLHAMHNVPVVDNRQQGKKESYYAMKHVKILFAAQRKNSCGSRLNEGLDHFFRVGWIDTVLLPT